MAVGSVLPEVPPRRSSWWPTWRAARRDAGAWVGAVVLGSVVLVAWLARHLAPTDPVSRDIIHRLLPPTAVRTAHRFSLGTDRLARDLFARCTFSASLSA